MMRSAAFLSILLCVLSADVVVSSPIIGPAIYRGYRVQKWPGGVWGLLRTFAHRRVNDRTLTDLYKSEQRRHQSDKNESGLVMRACLGCEKVEESRNLTISSGLLEFITAHLVTITYQLPVRRWTRPRHLCGGILLSTGWVLTAAHCVAKFQSEQRLTESLRIHTYVQRNRTETSFATGAEYRPGPGVCSIQRILPHPNFTEVYKLSTDIALLQLKRSCTDTDTETQAPLSTSKLDIPSDHRLPAIDEQQCVVAGSGRLEYGRIDHRQENQYLHVASVTRKPCEYLLAQLHGSDQTVSSCDDSCQVSLKVEQEHICAGGSITDGDTCQGDSGGPLVCLEAGKWRLVGIASMGIGCGTTGVPSIYTKISAHQDWLQQMMNDPSGEYNNTEPS